MPKSTLKIDWATHDAARFACERWHYSHSVPIGKLVKVGAWENEKFIGVVIFSRGATPNIGSPYGMMQSEICELTRVALTRHETPVSRIVAIALRFLRKTCPGIRMVVSYADQAQGHHGGIYQAGGWLYVGLSKERLYYRVNGKIEHPKSLHARYGTGGQSIEWLRENVDKNASYVSAGKKHKYLMPLDDELGAKLKPLAKTYPRAKQDNAGHHLALGGATPTRTLQTHDTNATV